MNTPFLHTAYLVAAAYTDPNGRMAPQIHAVRIFSEGATSLTIFAKDQIALDVYNYRARSYQEASDHLCYLVQTHQAFAWCRPLMDPRYMVPIDYLHVEMLKTDDVSKSVVSAILRRVLRLGRSGDQRTAEDMIANKASGLVRGTEVDEMNGMLRGLSHARARFWLKRDYTKMVEDKAKAEAEYEANEKAKSEEYDATLGSLTTAAFTDLKSETTP